MDFDLQFDRDRRRRTYQLCQLGFMILACVVFLAAGTAAVEFLLLFGLRMPPNLGLFLGIEKYQLILNALLGFGGTIGALFLVGRWPESLSWQRRAFLLLLMNGIDVVLWGMEHAVDLGFSAVPMEHDYFRYCLGAALGFSEIALMASLAADLASHLDQPQAVEFGRAAQTLATVSAILWFFLFWRQTNWDPPIWPLQFNPRGRRMLFMPFLGLRIMSTINLFQAGALCLLAARSSRKAVADIRKEESSEELLFSRSEDWK